LGKPEALEALLRGGMRVDRRSAPPDQALRHDLDGWHAGNRLEELRTIGHLGLPNREHLVLARSREIHLTVPGVDGDPAAAREIRAMDALHQGRFAGAGLSSQPDDFAFVHFERDAVKGADCLAIQDVEREVFVKVFHFQDGGHLVRLLVYRRELTSSCV